MHNKFNEFKGTTMPEEIKPTQPEYKDVFGIMKDRLATMSDLFTLLPGRRSFYNGRTQLTPIVKNDNEVHGTLFMYHTNSNPQLRVMLTFTHEDTDTCPLTKEQLDNYPTMDSEESISLLNAFMAHPDPQLHIFVEVILSLLRTEGFALKSVPYSDVLRVISPDIDIDTIEGSLFPLITFEHPETKQHGFLNVEPLIVSVKEPTCQ